MSKDVPLPDGHRKLGVTLPLGPWFLVFLPCTRTGQSKPWGVHLSPKKSCSWRGGLEKIGLVPGLLKHWAMTLPNGPKEHGNGSTWNHHKTTGFSPCFHLPGVHFGVTLCLTHSRIYWWSAQQTPWNPNSFCFWSSARSAASPSLGGFRLGTWKPMRPCDVPATTNLKTPGALRVPGKRKNKKAEFYLWASDSRTYVWTQQNMGTAKSVIRNPQQDIQKHTPPPSGFSFGQHGLLVRSYKNENVRTFWPRFLDQKKQNKNAYGHQGIFGRGELQDGGRLHLFVKLPWLTDFQAWARSRPWSKLASESFQVVFLLPSLNPGLKKATSWWTKILHLGWMRLMKRGNPPTCSSLPPPPPPPPEKKKKGGVPLDVASNQP